MLAACRGFTGYMQVLECVDIGRNKITTDLELPETARKLLHRTGHVQGLIMFNIEVIKR